jgi:uridine kinase
MLCIGIAGGTGAGKSTIVHALVDRLGATVLDLDSYYVDRGHLPADERRFVNYDEPAAIDVGLLLEHLARIASGAEIAKPVYSFETHTRVGVQRIVPTRVVVVEGLFPLWWPGVREHLDLKVFVDAPPDVRLARRLRRDVRERGRSAEAVLEQYLATVRIMHERYVEPCRAFADLVVTNDGAADEAGATLLAAVARIPRSGRPTATMNH